MLASTLGTILLLLFGSAALIAGGLAWQSASSRGSDAEQAREAAEWGFNAVIDQLNDPGNSYLLVTSWSNGNWVSVSDAERSACRISTNNRGEISTSSIITATQTVGNRQVRYRVTNFRPPQYPGDAPTTCTKFGNPYGGTARLTVVGEVLQNGTVVASRAMDRDVTVAFAADNDPAAPPISPPLAFLATGSGDSSAVSLNSTNVNDRPNFYFDRNGNWTGENGDTRIKLYCLLTCNGSSDLAAITSGTQPYSTDTLQPSAFTALFPSKPPYSSELDSVTNTPPWITSSPPANFPYTDSGNTSLLSYCRFITLPTQSGGSEPAIGCKVRIKLDNNKTLVVQTGRSTRPVVLYMMGKDEQGLGENSRIVNKLFQDARNSQPLSWASLRLYGDPSSSSLGHSINSNSTISNLKQCNNGDKQVLKFNKNSIVDGAMMWIPKGDITFEDHSSSSKLGFFGVIWTCKVKYGKNFVLLNNASSDDVARGIDTIFGLSAFRYVAQGVERSQ